MIAVERRCRDVCVTIWLLGEAVLESGLAAVAEPGERELFCGVDYNARLDFWSPVLPQCKMHQRLQQNIGDTHEDAVTKEEQLDGFLPH